MKRVLSIGLLITLVSACTAAQPNPSASQTQPAGQTQPTAARGADAESLAAAAARITDVCSLLPVDLAAKIVPGGSAPQSQQFPPYRCTVTNGTSVLEITIGASDTGGPVQGAEAIPGLAEGGYLERPAPDDAYLTVLLSKDAGALYVEVAGHDGKDHKDDAIAVAQKVLASLR